MICWTCGLSRTDRCASHTARPAPSLPSVPASKRADMRRTLTEEIRGGQLVPGTALPSDSALRVRFGVGRSTVSTVLHELVRDGLLDRRPGSPTTVRARPSAAPTIAGATMPGSVTEIASILPDPDEPRRFVQHIDGVVVATAVVRGPLAPLPSDDWNGLVAAAGPDTDWSTTDGLRLTGRNRFTTLEIDLSPAHHHLTAAPIAA